MNQMRNVTELSEVERLTLAAREALTDPMVERLATTAGNALELADRLNDEGTRAALHNALDRLTELHKVGALDTLFDVVMFMHAIRNAATDNIVERLFGFFEQMINTIGSEEMGSLAQNAREALDEAAEATAKAAPRGGLFATLAALSQPETQRSLAFLTAFANNLQQRTIGGRT
jgi:uncharacterized protein YjgD (DUF1641 family)